MSAKCKTNNFHLFEVNLHTLLLRGICVRQSLKFLCLLSHLLCRSELTNVSYALKLVMLSFTLNIQSLVAQATVRSKAPLGGYISYTIENTCIFQEVTSHRNTVATRWRRRKMHARLHCRLSATRCHSSLVTSIEALLS